MALPFPPLEQLSVAIESAINYTIQQITDAIHDALISVYNWIIGGIEWIINYIRGLMPFIITTVLTWTTIYKSVTSETMSLEKKVVSVFTAPFVSYVVGVLFDNLLPKAIRLPRFALPPRLVVEALADTVAYTSYTKMVTKTYIVEAEADTEAQIYY